MPCHIVYDAVEGTSNQEGGRVMHILLTDVVVCPRCGPEFGLILLADRIVERRVLEGRLGCPNCREQYEVSGGRLDLSTPGTVRGAAGSPDASDPAVSELETVPDPGVRIAALLGVTHGPAYVLLAGSDPALDESVRLFRGLDVFVSRFAPRGVTESFALLARAAGLLGQIAEERRRPIGMDTYLAVDRNAVYVDPES